MSNVLGIIITKDVVEKQCWDSLLNQTHQEFSFLISQRKPQFSDKNPVREKYMNCSENREVARCMALANKWADYFLFVDSDVVLPKEAAENFLLQMVKAKKHAVGGWYKMINSPKWIGGRWVDDNVFHNFINPERSLILTDIMPMGCAMFSRELLEKITFGNGLDKTCKDALSPDDQIYLGECGDIGNKINDLGYKMYMDGSVICEHLERTW